MSDKESDNVIHLVSNNEDPDEAGPDVVVIMQSDTASMEPNELLELAKSANLSEIVIVGRYKDDASNPDIYVGSSDAFLDSVYALLGLGKARIIDIMRGKE